MNYPLHRLTLKSVGLFSVLLAAPILTGCGGGSGSLTRAAAPTPTTRAAVQKTLGRHVNSLSMSGVSPLNAVNSTTSVSGGNSGAGNSHSFSTPNIGGFFNSLTASANANHGGRAVRFVKHTRVVSDDLDPYLGLYTTVTTTDGKIETLLFLDAAKTQPAGKIVSIFPSDYTVFPQIYQDTFEFTGGTQAGSKGHYNSTYAADGTFTSDFSNTSTVDGTSYSGQSNYSANGTSSYSGSYSSTKDNTSGSYQGEYQADGSGFSRTSDSTGYASEYRYAVGGSFTATISGPDPGLPAQIVFDEITGKYTITYADGTAETYDWGFWGNTDSGVSGGDSGSASTGNADQASEPNSGRSVKK